MIRSAKKTLALFMALLMLAALSVPSFAEGESATGSITVSNATMGETYALYKIFDLTYSGSAVSYTYTSTGEGDEILTLLEEMFTFTETQVPNVYSVTEKETDGAAIGEFFNDHAEDLASLMCGSPVTASGSSVEFTGLGYGYYFVTSSLGTTVTVDSTLPDVSVIDKNQGPDWSGDGKVILNSDGTVTESTAKYGDVVDFMISVRATAYVGTELAPVYYIKDTLGPGYSPATNVAVTVGGKTVSAGTDYTLTQDGNNFEIKLPFADEATGSLYYGAEAEIIVTYSATILNTAVIAGEGNPNIVNFTYDHKTGEGPSGKKPYDDSNIKKTTTNVYAIGILKVDPKGAPLTGAKFTVTQTVSSKSQTVSVPITSSTASKGVYEYDANGAVTEFEVGSDGVLVLKGLDAGVYTIAEVVSPAGYNLLKDTVDIKAALSETSTYTTTITTYYDKDGNVVKTQQEGGSTKTTTTSTNVVPLTVVNQAGTELPSTGGIGTTIFYLLGGILLVGAAVLLITKKRMNVE